MPRCLPAAGPWPAARVSADGQSDTTLSAVMVSWSRIQRHAWGGGRCKAEIHVANPFVVTIQPETVYPGGRNRSAASDFFAVRRWLACWLEVTRWLCDRCEGLAALKAVTVAWHRRSGPLAVLGGGDWQRIALPLRLQAGTFSGGREFHARPIQCPWAAVADNRHVGDDAGATRLPRTRPLCSPSRGVYGVGRTVCSGVSASDSTSACEFTAEDAGSQ